MIRVEYVVEDGALGEDLVASALSGAELVGSSGGGEMYLDTAATDEALFDAYQEYLEQVQRALLEDFLGADAAVDALERRMWLAARDARAARRPGTRLFDGLEAAGRRWVLDPIRRRPYAAALVVAGVAAAGYWLWKNGVFADEEGARPSAEKEVPEEARCPICLERAVSAAGGADLGEYFFVELCGNCGAATCGECAATLAAHAKRDGRGPSCAMCRAPLASSSAARYLKLRHLLQKRPRGPHVAQCWYELASMRSRAARNPAAGFGVPPFESPAPLVESNSLPAVSLDRPV